ncbi:hypothetical protein CEH05_20620 (plasmid) [Halobacillus halophilus]|nr:hypothetical protein CEH05_20620 [Halobacillus halophilus]
MEKFLEEDDFFFIKGFFRALEVTRDRDEYITKNFQGMIIIQHIMCRSYSSQDVFESGIIF